MSGPPTLTGSHIPGVIPNNLTVIDFTGYSTAWYESASQMDSSGVRSNSGNATAVETYAVSGDMPIPIVSSMEGNPEANYNYVSSTVVSIGNYSIFITNYDVSPQGSYEFNRIITATSYLDRVFSSLSSEAQAAIGALNGITYTDRLDQRSGVNVTQGIFMLTAKDMVGTDSRGGFSTLSIADRIVHDGQHVIHYQTGQSAAMGDLSTQAQRDTMLTLENDAIRVGLDAGNVIANLPEAQASGSYADTLSDLAAYLNTSSPSYQDRQQKLRDRFNEAIPTLPDVGNPPKETQNNR